MSEHFQNDSFECSFDCTTANQCAYYNELGGNSTFNHTYPLPQQVMPPSLPTFSHQPNEQVQPFTNEANYFSNYDDGVVPMNAFENSEPQHAIFGSEMYDLNSAVVTMPFNDSHDDQPTQYHNGYSDQNQMSFPPCQGSQQHPWNFAHCYGFYGEPACQFSNIIDMEDFM